MITTMTSQLTRQGIDALRSGQRDAGRKFLGQAITANPRDTLAWLWLATIAPNTAEKRHCLEEVLKLEPDHVFALRDLAALDTGQQSAQAGPAYAASGVRRQASSMLQADPELTVDDTIAIVEHRQANDADARLKKARARRIRTLLAVLGLLCALLLVGRSVLLAVDTNDAGASTPLTGTFTPESVARTGQRMVGGFSLPGAAFLDGRAQAALTPAQPLISLLPDTGTEGNETACSLPHGTAVLLLDARTHSDGSLLFRVKHRGCSGWVPERLINAEHVEALVSGRPSDGGLAEK